MDNESGENSPENIKNPKIFMLDPMIDALHSEPLAFYNYLDNEGSEFPSQIIAHGLIETIGVDNNIPQIQGTIALLEILNRMNDDGVDHDDDIYTNVYYSAAVNLNNMIENEINLDFLYAYALCRSRDNKHLSLIDQDTFHAKILKIMHNDSIKDYMNFTDTIAGFSIIVDLFKSGTHAVKLRLLNSMTRPVPNHVLNRLDELSHLATVDFLSYNEIFEVTKESSPLWGNFQGPIPQA